MDHPRSKGMSSSEASQESRVYGRAEGHGLYLSIYRQGGAQTGHGIVMVHGGAWNANNRLTPHVVCHALAMRGMTVFSLDFRDGRNGKHPIAVRDITAGIRYVRRHAEHFGIDAARIGLIGSSSGGHLALMSAYRPDAAEHRGTELAASPEYQQEPDENDSAYEAADELSAEAAYVIALWPVSDPLARFRHAQDTGREELLAAHLRYYADEADMHKASIPRLLKDGEAQCLPPTLIVQPGADQNVPQAMTLDLLSALQQANATVQYLFYPGLPHAFAYEASPETTALIDDLWGFITRHR